MRSTLALAAALVLTPACTIYFPADDDDDDDCEWGGGEADPDYGDGAAEPAEGLRNPYTGQCEWFGGGGGGGCDDPCAPCDQPAGDSDGDRAPLPSWGYCSSSCSGLDELTCLATAGCRGGYVETCGPDQVCDFGVDRYFYECWAVDQTGPIQGSCENLDAWGCSLHDDCVAVHNDACETPGTGAAAEPLVVPCLGSFVSCQPETSDQPTGCYSDAECAADEHCNATEVCEAPPECTDPMGGGDGNGDGIACPPVCYGWCVPDEDPPPPVACEEIASEEECNAREDCTAMYIGVNCTCTAPDDPSTCTCEDWVYQSCSSMGG